MTIGGCSNKDFTFMKSEFFLGTYIGILGFNSSSSSDPTLNLTKFNLFRFEIDWISTFLSNS